jgi:PTS system cellobiose-specific IIC component
MKKFINSILPFFLKIGSNNYLTAIRDGLSFTVPFTIVGSLFLIVGNFPIVAWTNFIKPYTPMLNSVVNVSFGMLGLISAIGIGYSLAKNFKIELLSNTIITTIAFLLATVDNKFQISIANLSATGMFTAILVAILTTVVSRFVVAHNLTIKLPDSVPPAVAQSFNSLTPAALVLLIVWLIRVVLQINVNDILQRVFQPLIFGLNTIPGLLVYTFVALALWLIGVHGPNLLAGIVTPIFLSNIAANIKAFQAGQTVPYDVADGFWTLFQNIGGSGCTIGLVLAMLVARSKMYRDLGRLSIGPAIFCINEPVIFGFPIVMNPIMAIPFVATPMILGAMTIVFMRLGWVGRIVTEVPWTTPPIIGPYLATNGSIGAAIWSACTIVISYALYFPFFKILDRKQSAAEATEEKSNAPASASVVSGKGATE